MAHGVRLSIGFDFLQFNCPPVYASMFPLQGLKSLFLHKSEKFRLLSRIAMTVTSSFTTTHENPWVQILWFRHWTVSPQMSRRWKWIWWEQLSLENPSQGSAKTQGKSCRFQTISQGNLVGGLEHVLFLHILGVSSNPN